MSDNGGSNLLDDVDNLIEDDRPGAQRDANEIDALLPALARMGPAWEPGGALPEVPWTPHLVDRSRKQAMQVHLGGELPRWLTRRIRNAHGAGYTIYVALELSALYDPAVQGLLADTDAYVYVLDGEPLAPTKRRHHLAAMADLGVAVSPQQRTVLARKAWDQRAAGSGNDKGRRLEALLAFLLSQVSGFKVHSRNFRTETAEIDIVVQITNFDGRSWCMLSVPFIIVESKNTDTKATQPIVTGLIRRLQTSRSTARIGLLFSVAGFTSDAREEELRLSEGNLCVVFFGPDEIEAMIDDADLDDFLESRVNAALLR